MRCAPGSPARLWRPSSPRRSSPRCRGGSRSPDSREMATRPVHVVSRQVPPEFVPRRDLDWQGVVALETHQLDLPGISLRVAPKRYYPFGPLAAHLLGYVGEVSKSELAQDDGDYVGGDLVGKAGLEKTFDKDLRGDPGDQQVEVDALGRRVRGLQEEPDRSGGTLTLTLDRD